MRLKLECTTDTEERNVQMNATYRMGSSEMKAFKM